MAILISDDYSRPALTIKETMDFANLRWDSSIYVHLKKNNLDGVYRVVDGKEKLMIYKDTIIKQWPQMAEGEKQHNSVNRKKTPPKRSPSNEVLTCIFNYFGSYEWHNSKRTPSDCQEIISKFMVK